MDPDGFFPLIVRGGSSLAMRYDGSVLTVRFHRAAVAAGEPSTFMRLPPGTGAWVDRPVNDAEPVVLRQEVSHGAAREIAAVLRNEVRFYRFICSNTNSGHFQVFRSEPAFALVPTE
jgi:hypothetical protein